MTEHTHHTAPTQYVEAAGIRFAYRRFGKSGTVPTAGRIALGRPLNIGVAGGADNQDAERRGIAIATS